MNQVTEPCEAEGAAERRAPTELTERVAVPLARRSRASNLKWSTWRWRLGSRKPQTET